MLGLGRQSLFGLAVLAAAGVPYALNNVAKDPRQQSASLADDELPPAPGGAGVAGLGSVEPPVEQTNVIPPYRAPQPLEGPQVADLNEVLRFDINPSWLIQRWPRVMNCPDDQGLQAYRVLLVTGAGETDLAGALTYYFTPEQKLQQIRFQGTSGDTRRLVRLLTTQFNFIPVRPGHPGEQLFQVQRNGRAVSQLQVRVADILDAGAPTARYRVDLVLERPSEHRWFSEARPAFDRTRWP